MEKGKDENLLSPSPLGRPDTQARFPHPPLLWATSPKPSPSSKLKVRLSFRLKLKIMMIFQITLLTKTLFIFPFLTIASFIFSVLDQIKVHACSVLFTMRTLKKNLYQNTFSFKTCIEWSFIFASRTLIRSYFPPPIMHLVCPAQNFALSSISLWTTVVPMRRI